MKDASPDRWDPSDTSDPSDKMRVRHSRFYHHSSIAKAGHTPAARRASRFRLWHEETIAWIVRLKQRSL